MGKSQTLENFIKLYVIIIYRKVEVILCLIQVNGGKVIRLEKMLNYERENNREKIYI